jgi:iron complex outermembrane receptor protein
LVNWPGGIGSGNPISKITKITNINVNGGKLRTNGLDLDVRWKMGKTDWGLWSAQLNGSYVLNYDFTDPAGITQHTVGKLVDDQGNGLNALANGAGVIPEWRHTLTLALSNERWSLALIHNYQTGYDDGWNANCANNGASDTTCLHHVGDYYTLDLAASLRASKDVVLSMGVKNIEDKDPLPQAGAGNTFQQGFDITSYDPRSRFWYLSVNYKFK